MPMGQQQNPENASNTERSFSDLKQAFATLSGPSLVFRSRGASNSTPAVPQIGPSSTDRQQSEAAPKLPLASGPPVPDISQQTLYPPAAFHSPTQPPELGMVNVSPEQLTVSRIQGGEGASIPSRQNGDQQVVEVPFSEEAIPGGPEPDDFGTLVVTPAMDEAFWEEIDVFDEDDSISWPSDSDGSTAQSDPAGRRQIRAFRSRSSRENWLYNEFVPRMEAQVLERGFISIFQLARAMETLEQDERLCRALRQGLDRDSIRITRSIAHCREGGVSAAEAEAFFGSLLHRMPYPADVLRYLHLDHLALEQDSIHFIASAFEMQRLTRTEESIYLDRLLRHRVPGRRPRVGQDDPEAWKALTEDSLWLVCRIAGSYTGRGLEYDDLVQEGFLGLMVGIDRFEPDRSPRLMNYVPIWIHQHIRRAISDKSRLIRLPVHVTEGTLASLRTIAHDYADQYGELPTVKWCADQLDSDEKAIESIFSFLFPPCSLDALSSSRQERLLTGNPEDTVVLAAEERALRLDMLTVLWSLTHRERAILVQRYGLDGGDERTLEQISQDQGVTRERIRQIEYRALEKLLQPSYSRLIRDWYPYRQSPTKVEATLVGESEGQPRDVNKLAPEDEGLGYLWKAMNVARRWEPLLQGVDAQALQDAIRYALKWLSSRKRELLNLRFGLHDGQVRTLDELHEEMGIPRDAIEVLLADAISDVRVECQRRLKVQKDISQKQRISRKVPGGGKRAARAKTAVVRGGDSFSSDSQ